MVKGSRMMSFIKKLVRLFHKNDNTSLGRKEEEVIAYLEQTSTSGSINQVPGVLQCVMSDNPIISKKAAHTIRILFAKEKEKIFWAAIAKNRGGDFRYAFNQNFKTYFDKFQQINSDDAVHLYGLASLSWNGYCREEALDNMFKMTSHEILPYYSPCRLGASS